MPENTIPYVRHAIRVSGSQIYAEYESWLATAWDLSTACFSRNQRIADRLRP